MVPMRNILRKVIYENNGLLIECDLLAMKHIEGIYKKHGILYRF